MIAMIFAAGLGTRLAPLTDTRPKALVEVGGVAALERVIQKIRSTGIGRIIVNVHHFAGQVIDFLKSDRFSDLDIMISDESDRLLDTGGGVIKAIEEFSVDEPLLLHNADIMTDFDLGKMMERYESSADIDALLLVDAGRKSSRRLLFDHDGMMRGWINHSTGEVRPRCIDCSHADAMAFGGVHIIGPSVYDSLRHYRDTHGEVFSITPFYIDVCQSHALRAYHPDESYNWWDIGRMATYEAANQYYSAK